MSLSCGQTINIINKMFTCLQLPHLPPQKGIAHSLCALPLPYLQERFAAGKGSVERPIATRFGRSSCRVWMCMPARCNHTWRQQQQRQRRFRGGGRRVWIRIQHTLGQKRWAQGTAASCGRGQLCGWREQRGRQVAACGSLAHQWVWAWSGVFSRVVILLITGREGERSAQDGEPSPKGGCCCVMLSSVELAISILQ